MTAVISSSSQTGYSLLAYTRKPQLSSSLIACSPKNSTPLSSTLTVTHFTLFASVTGILFNMLPLSTIHCGQIKNPWFLELTLYKLYNSKQKVINCQLSLSVWSMKRWTLSLFTWMAVSEWSVSCSALHSVTLTGTSGLGLYSGLSGCGACPAGRQAGRVPLHQHVPACGMAANLWHDSGLCLFHSAMQMSPLKPIIRMEGLAPERRESGSVRLRHTQERKVEADRQRERERSANSLYLSLGRQQVPISIAEEREWWNNCPATYYLGPFLIVQRIQYLRLSLWQN